MTRSMLVMTCYPTFHFIQKLQAMSLKKKYFVKIRSTNVSHHLILLLLFSRSLLLKVNETFSKGFTFSENICMGN